MFPECCKSFQRPTAVPQLGRFRSKSNKNRAASASWLREMSRPFNIFR
jgi:hypothetical protein